MPYSQIEQIIDFIESMLNKPLIDLLINQGEATQKKFRKRQKKIEVKTFFSHIVSNLGFVYLS